MCMPLPTSARRHSTFGKVAAGGEDGEGNLAFADKAYLVNRIKALQRSSPESKQKWWSYCSAMGRHDYDPNRHDERFLQGFLNSYENGQIAGQEAQEWSAEGLRKFSNSSPEDKSGLIQRIKEVQRSSTQNKESWYTFCSNEGTSNFDPNRHDESFLRRYLEAFETMRLGGAGSRTSASSTAAGPSSSSAASGDGGASWDGWSSPPPAAGEWGTGGDWCGGMNQWGKMGGMKGAMKGQSMGPQWDMAAMMGMPGMNLYGKGMMASMMAGMDFSGKGMMAMGKGKAAAPDDTEWRGQGLTTMGKKWGQSEFGILEAPPESLLARKRGASSMSVVSGPTAGGLMTEAEAKAFQKSLKRPR